MAAEIKLFIPANEQMLIADEEQLLQYRDELAGQGVISWILTIN